MDIDKPSIDESDKEILIQSINHGSISQGKYVSDFERAFSKYCRARYACAVMNGTAALHLALRALGIKSGDEVLVPTLTFVASVTPVSYCGAKPVFVDCRPDTWCMDTEDLRKKITRRTKAVVPVHLYGNACNMDEICQIAERHDLDIIEDCAEAHGTLYKAKHVGSFSTIAFFSFYKNKPMTTGEGGICITNKLSLLERMRLLRSHGKEKVEDLDNEDYALKQFISKELGFNYRMTDLQAALGLSQLTKLDEMISKRIYYAQLYSELLNGLDIVFPYYDKKIVKHTYWGVPVLLKTTELKMKAMLEFRRFGIRLRPFFNPCHQQPFYLNHSPCPVAEDVSRRGIVLPNTHSLKEEDIYTVSNLLKGFLSSK
jgi:perosamine synthetase